MQGFSGGDSSGSEDEDMDSEDEEIDIGEVKDPWSLLDAPSVHAIYVQCEACLQCTLLSDADKREDSQ